MIYRKYGDQQPKAFAKLQFTTMPLLEIGYQFKGAVVEMPEVVLVKIRANLTYVRSQSMGNKLSTKLIQVFQPTIALNLLVASQEIEMGVLQHILTMSLGEG